MVKLEKHKSAHESSGMTRRTRSLNFNFVENHIQVLKTNLITVLTLKGISDRNVKHMFKEMKTTGSK